MQPLVSCVMPTANRRAYVPQAIRYFLAQDYNHKELVIVDDGGESVADLVPHDPQIRYLRQERKVTLGEKRNECVRACRGDLIMHWDDDDWMAPRRISYQVEHLLEQKAEVCGLQRMLFYDPSGAAVWLYQYPSDKRPWLAGGSLLYTRDFWRRSPFPNVQVASDTRFILNRKMDRYVALPDYTFYVALIHRNNTSHKRIQGAYWKRWEGNIEEIIGADLGFYQSLYHPGESHPPGNLSSLDVRRAKVTSTSAGGSSSRGRLSQNGILKAPADDEHSAQVGLHRMAEGPGMRIGYVVLNFPPLSETFIRRELMALCEAGHHVFVYTCYRSRDPLSPDPAHPNLVIRQIAFLRNSAALAAAARRDEVEHIHSSLMLAAHHAAFEAARTLQAPFTMTAYSGHDIFTAGDQRLFGKISNDPCCEAIIVEDPFMRDYVVEHLGAEPQKIAIIPNSFDLDLYRRRELQPLSDRIVILAIARFVEKKGLIHLVQAFNQLCAKRHDVELWLVGEGPEGARLRQAANRNPLIRFMGNLPEAETRRCYTNAHIFCLPCVRTASGDADGIPTTTLEAMAFALPVVTSNLLSTPYYVRDGQEGFLSEPGTSAALSVALEQLCDDPDLRLKMGQAGRARIEELCDLKQNVRRLQGILINARWRRWSESLVALVAQRKEYTEERKRFYSERRDYVMQFLQPRGRLLDIGCGAGAIRFHVSPDVCYVGCDPLPAGDAEKDFPFVVAYGEALPFADESFDSVLIYSVLMNVFNVDVALNEAVRVLKSGGALLLHECVNDPNPIHLNHLTDNGLRERVTERLTIAAEKSIGEQYLMLKAVKFAGPVAVEVQSPPLASIAITTYNRKQFLRACIDSALKQSYQPVEVIVVDDGSTDGSREILEQYGDAIRVAYNDSNRGIAYSKNRALRMTSEKARYVAVLDSDDYYHPQFIERCVGFLERTPETGLVYTDDVWVDHSGRVLGHDRSVDPWDIETWLRTCNLRGDSWVARRELVMRTALHEESMRLDVDYDLFYQLLEITSFAHLAEFLVFHRCHEGQSTRHQLELAKCHAVNLVKYGYSPEYAWRRARRNPEWSPAILEGIELGKKLYQLRRSSTASKENAIG